MVCLRVCVICIAYFCYGEASVTPPPSAMAITKCSDTYEIKEEVGKGHYGTVYKIEEKNNPSRPVALKINKDKKGHDVEKKFLEALETPSGYNEEGRRYTPRYYGECMLDDKVGLIMEYVREKFDTQLYSGLTIPRKISVIYQLLSAVKQLHSHGFAHLDIKPDNIRLGSDGLLKIIDFGLACWDKDMPIDKYRGTPMFSAPELLAERFDDANMYKSDVWSAGVIIFHILTGNQLLESNSKTNSCIKEKREGSESEKKCTRRLNYMRLKLFFFYLSMQLYHDSKHEMLSESDFKLDCSIELQCQKEHEIGIHIKMLPFYSKVPQNVGGYLLQNMLFNLLKFDPVTRDTIDNALVHPIFGFAYDWRSSSEHLADIRTIRQTYVPWERLDSAPKEERILAIQTWPNENSLTPQLTPQEAEVRRTDSWPESVSWPESFEYVTTESSKHSSDSQNAKSVTNTKSATTSTTSSSRCTLCDYLSGKWNKFVNFLSSWIGKNKAGTQASAASASDDREIPQNAKSATNTKSATTSTTSSSDDGAASSSSENSSDADNAEMNTGSASNERPAHSKSSTTSTSTSGNSATQPGGENLSDSEDAERSTGSTSHKNRSAQPIAKSSTNTADSTTSSGSTSDLSSAAQDAETGPQTRDSLSSQQSKPSTIASHKINALGSSRDHADVGTGAQGGSSATLTKAGLETSPKKKRTIRENMDSGNPLLGVRQIF